jgi:hypothetical protein
MQQNVGTNMNCCKKQLTCCVVCCSGGIIPETQVIKVLEASSLIS